MTIALRMRRKLNEFCITNFLEMASPLNELETLAETLEKNAVVGKSDFSWKNKH